VSRVLGLVFVLAALAAPAQAAPPRYLAIAEQGFTKTERAFWDPQLHWYDWRLTTAIKPRPLASLWAAFPLIELGDAIAIADPTPAHKADVEALGRGAERYLDPNLRPPGYTTYRGITNPREHTYFDDNGWFEIAFLDAYQATGDPRFLHDSEQAWRFIAEKGWNPDGGGFWWETLHRHLTSEPLAAEIDTGLRLYELTGQRTYLTSSERYLAWANAHSWNADERLYARSPTDGTTMDYVEGPMIGAELELCAIRHVKGTCAPAEQLASASVAAFGTQLDWTPVADTLYLRFLLELSAADHNPAWAQIAKTNALAAVRHARSEDGLYFKHWGGGAFPTRLLQPDAATLALFAWVGAFKQG
jgi:hypothetical protein